MEEVYWGMPWVQWLTSRRLPEMPPLYVHILTICRLLIAAVQPMARTCTAPSVKPRCSIGIQTLLVLQRAGGSYLVSQCSSWPRHCNFDSYKASATYRAALQAANKAIRLLRLPQRRPVHC